MNKDSFLKIYKRNFNHRIRVNLQNYGNNYETANEVETCLQILSDCWDKTLGNNPLTAANRENLKKAYISSVNSIPDFSKAIKDFYIIEFDKMRLEGNAPAPFAVPEIKGDSERVLRQKRQAEIFQETMKAGRESTHGLKKKITDEMLSGVTGYTTLLNNNLQTFLKGQQNISRPSDADFEPQETIYEVLDADTLISARRLVEMGYDPLALIMANKISIGGGVFNGTDAQEEATFRAALLGLALYPHGNLVTSGAHQGRMYYKTQIPTFGSYYVPRVQVFRDCTQNYAYIDPFVVDCIEIAGADLGKPHLYEKELRDPAGNPLTGQALLNAFENMTMEKIKHLLEVAILRKKDSLILGALSCGAFKLPGDKTGITATIVARAYERVLAEPRYRNRFKHIDWAIMKLGPEGENNYKIFSEMIARLNALPRLPRVQNARPVAGLSVAGIGPIANAGAGAGVGVNLNVPPVIPAKKPVVPQPKAPAGKPVVAPVKPIAAAPAKAPASAVAAPAKKPAAAPQPKAAAKPVAAPQPKAPAPKPPVVPNKPAPIASPAYDGGDADITLAGNPGATVFFSDMGNNVGRGAGAGASANIANVPSFYDMEDEYAESRRQNAHRARESKFREEARKIEGTVSTAFNKKLAEITSIVLNDFDFLNGLPPGTHISNVKNELTYYIEAALRNEEILYTAIEAAIGNNGFEVREMMINACDLAMEIVNLKEKGRAGIANRRGAGAVFA